MWMMEREEEGRGLVADDRVELAEGVGHAAVAGHEYDALAGRGDLSTGSDTHADSHGTESAMSQESCGLRRRYRLAEPKIGQGTVSAHDRVGGDRGGDGGRRAKWMHRRA